MLPGQDVRIEIQDPNKYSPKLRDQLIVTSAAKMPFTPTQGILESTNSSEDHCNFLLSSYCEKHFSIKIEHVGMCMIFYFWCLFLNSGHYMYKSITANRLSYALLQMYIGIHIHKIIFQDTHTCPDILLQKMFILEEPYSLGRPGID